MNKKSFFPYLLFSAIAALLAAFSGVAQAQDAERDEQTIVHEQRYYSDGSVETVELFWNAKRKAYVERSLAKNSNPADANETFDSALVERVDTWRSNTKKLTFGFTPMAMQFRKDVKKIMNKYCNRRRGTKGVPKFKAGKTEVPVKSLASFGDDFMAYQNQYQNDDILVVCMTEDDLFFKNPFGTLLEHDLVAFTRTLSKSAVTNPGPRWIGTYWIEEADVFLRSDFFQQSRYVQRLILAGSLRFALGYQKPIWIWDLNADKRWFSEAMFEDAGHSMWKDLIQMWDAMYYSDTLVGVTAKKKGYLDKARALPHDGAVMDTAGYEVPTTSLGGFPLTDHADILFMTNLKAFDKKKEFSAEFKLILPDSVGGASEQKLFTLKGNQFGYPGKLGVNGKEANWYPDIFLNSVKFGRQKDLDALNNAIANFGTPKSVDGASYQKAIEVEVTLKGYLTENGGSKKLTRTFYFVNSDNGN